MSENNDQQHIPEPHPVEPERFDAPTAPAPPDPHVAHDAFPNFEPTLSSQPVDATVDPVLRDDMNASEPMGLPEPLVVTEPVPAMVGAPLGVPGDLQEIRGEL